MEKALDRVSVLAEHGAMVPLGDEVLNRLTRHGPNLNPHGVVQLLKVFARLAKAHGAGAYTRPLLSST